MYWRSLLASWLQAAVQCVTPTLLNWTWSVGGKSMFAVLLGDIPYCTGPYNLEIESLVKGKLTCCDAITTRRQRCSSVFVCFILNWRMFCGKIIIAWSHPAQSSRNKLEKIEMKEKFHIFSKENSNGSPEENTNQFYTKRLAIHGWKDISYKSKLQFFYNSKWEGTEKLRKKPNSCRTSG